MKLFPLARELAGQARNDWRAFRQTRKEMREIKPMVEGLVWDTRRYAKLLKNEARLSGDTSFPGRMKLGKERKKTRQAAHKLVWKYFSKPLIDSGDLKNCKSGTQILSGTDESGRVTSGHVSILLEKREDYLTSAIQRFNNYLMAPASILLTLIGIIAPPFNENGEHTRGSYLAWSMFAIPAVAIGIESLWLGAVERRFGKALSLLDDAVKRVVPGIKEKSDELWAEFREKSSGVGKIEMKFLYYKTLEKCLATGPSFQETVLKHWGKK